MKPRSGRGSDLCGRHEQRRGYLERAGYTLLHFWFRYCGNPNPDHREHHPRVCPDEAHLWPSEVVTLGLLHALKGVGNRPFYRWLTRDSRALFPRLPERTRLFRLLKTHQGFPQ